MIRLEVDLTHGKGQNQGQSAPDVNFNLEFGSLKDCEYYIRNRLFKGLGEGKFEPQMFVLEQPGKDPVKSMWGTHAGYSFVIHIRDL